MLPEVCTSGTGEFFRLLRYVEDNLGVPVAIETRKDGTYTGSWVGFYREYQITFNAVEHGDTSTLIYVYVKRDMLESRRGKIVWVQPLHTKRKTLDQLKHDAHTAIDWCRATTKVSSL